MKIISKLNELKPTDLNCNVFDVYSYDGLSMQDLLCQFFTKINECIKASNETIDLATWLVNEGLNKEVVKELMLLIEDGTVEKLINVNLFNTLNTKIENINSQLAHKANQSDLVIERERINMLSRLNEGSTTGDAELIDVRVDVFGNENTNAGESIRSQIKNISSGTTSKHVFSFEKLSFEPQAIYVNINSFANSRLNVRVECSEDIISKNNKLQVGVTDLSDNEINNIASITVNEDNILYTDCDIKMVRVYIQNILNDGDVTITVTSEGMFENIKSLEGKSDENSRHINILSKKIFGDKLLGDFYENKTIVNIYEDGVGKDKHIYCNNGYAKDEKIYIELKSDCLEDNSVIYGAITYPTGQVAAAFTIKPNSIIEFTPEDNATQIYIWIPSTNVVKEGVVSVIIRNYEISNLEEKIHKNIDDKIYNLKNDIILNSTKKTFSIIGDSYSSYKKWIPEGYSYWYADEGNSQTNNVSSVKDTWWWKLSNETKLSLLTNSSYSGSTICNTGYSGADSSSTSFITRIKKDIGENKALQVKPNIIFIFGGTNDSWANSPIGSLKYSNWTDDDLKQVLPSFCYLVDYLKLWNPHSRIINIVNTDLKTDISQGMKIACEYYEIENLVLENIGKENGHPNKEGMNSIKDQIISIL